MLTDPGDHSTPSGPLQWPCLVAFRGARANGRPLVEPAELALELIGSRRLTLADAARFSATAPSRFGRRGCCWRPQPVQVPRSDTRPAKAPDSFACDWARHAAGPPTWCATFGRRAVTYLRRRHRRSAIDPLDRSNDAGPDEFTAVREAGGGGGGGGRARSRDSRGRTASAVRRGHFLLVRSRMKWSPPLSSPLRAARRVEQVRLSRVGDPRSRRASINWCLWHRINPPWEHHTPLSRLRGKAAKSPDSPVSAGVIRRERPELPSPLREGGGGRWGPHETAENILSSDRVTCRGRARDGLQNELEFSSRLT